MQPALGTSQFGTGPGWGSVGVPGRGGSSAVQLVFGTSSEWASAGEEAHVNAPTARQTSVARRTRPPIPRRSYSDERLMSAGSYGHIVTSTASGEL
jgi:hypothetical protein